MAAARGYTASLLVLSCVPSPNFVTTFDRRKLAIGLRGEDVRTRVNAPRRHSQVLPLRPCSRTLLSCSGHACVHGVRVLAKISYVVRGRSVQPSRSGGAPGKLTQLPIDTTQAPPGPTGRAARRPGPP